MKIVFIRHGESEANVQQIISNTGYVYGLTDKGKSQANSLAFKLRREYTSPVKIISSPLKRADETSSIISAFFDSDYVIDNRLIEFHTGILEGKSDTNSWNQLFDLWKLWLEGESHSEAIPGGESLVDVIARVQDFLKSIISEHNEKDIIFCISHGGVLQTALPNLFNVDTAEKLKSHDFKNTDIVEINYSKGQDLSCSKYGSL